MNWASKDGTQRIIHGDCVDGLQSLPDGCVNCCVTSPPYWGLRDYGREGQIGLEPTPDEYVAKMVDVFREVRRVLRKDGTLWLNLGDSYASGEIGRHDRKEGRRADGGDFAEKERGQSRQQIRLLSSVKTKELVGIPWRVAFALQADGWWLRQDIIWHKPNPMPESVRDRCTKAHEYLFLLAKAERYYYDAESISEPASYAGQMRGGSKNRYEQNAAGMDCKVYDTRNKRSVWTVGTKPYKGVHFATYPPELIEPCILAGCPESGTVLDPFVGSGTTLAVAARLGRNGIGCELNSDYIRLAIERITPELHEQRFPLFSK